MSQLRNCVRKSFATGSYVFKLYGARQTSYAFGSALAVFAIQTSAGAQLGRLAMVIRLGYHLEPEMKEMASA
jgi:hypothetical protein